MWVMKSVQRKEIWIILGFCSHDLFGRAELLWTAIFEPQLLIPYAKIKIMKQCWLSKKNKNV